MDETRGETLDDATVVIMAKAMIDLDLPPECIAGVRSNLAALAEHAARLDGA